MESLGARIGITPTCIGRWQHESVDFIQGRRVKSVEFLAPPTRCLLAGQGKSRVLSAKLPDIPKTSSPVYSLAVERRVMSIVVSVTPCAWAYHLGPPLLF